MQEDLFSGKIIDIPIEEEVKNSYLNYSMSVIVSRALPDVRDGLKPVHRRILFGMYDMGIRHNLPTKKSARIVGDVLGKLHPHGDQSVYDALVRLAQEFSLRYPYIYGQGNFGSVDGDPPAAMRYTEARLSKIAEENLHDLEKETVGFVPNYDSSLLEPSVLPSKIPTLLINGASGIAVGMATNIAPHNITEVCSGVIAYIDNPDIDTIGLMEFIKAPDLPTGGQIYGKKGIYDAYETGHGRFTIRSKYNLEEKKERTAIIFYEIPYQVNKANLIISIAELVKDKKIEGISDIRDESDRDGLRIVIETKKNANVNLILNYLFTNTSLQINFSINSLALVNGRPETLPLKSIIHHFVEHRKEVIKKRTVYDLNKAKQRLHIVEGLKIAIENLDSVLETIKKSKSLDNLRIDLISSYKLDKDQVGAILDIRLQKLSSMETEKLINEHTELIKTIEKLGDILSQDKEIYKIIKKETKEIITNFGDERKSEIVGQEIDSIEEEDLIQQEDVVLIITRLGYIKRVYEKEYKTQGRGGRGSNSSNLIDEDFINQVFIASTHDYLLILTNLGKAYWIKVYQVPIGSKTSRGAHIKSILQLSHGEEISAVISIKDFVDDEFIFFATRNGTIKRTSLSELKNAKKRGVNAINLREDDSVASAFLSSGKGDILLVTKNGYGLRFAQQNLRVMGRQAQGNKGIKLKDDDKLASALEIKDSHLIMIISEKGFGKRFDPQELKSHNTNTMGQSIFSKTGGKGSIADIINIHEDDNLIAITEQGIAIKVEAEKIRKVSRQAGGVRIVNIKGEDRVASIAVSKLEDEEILSQLDQEV